MVDLTIEKVINTLANEHISHICMQIYGYKMNIILTIFHTQLQPNIVHEISKLLKY